MDPSAPSVSDLLPDILGKDFCLPPMPTVVGELFTLIQQPVEDIQTSRIVKLVENDPALVSHLLRLANSPYYGSLRDITHLTQAITRIGLDETLSALHFYLLRQMLPMDSGGQSFNPEQFWMHSWAVATIACRLGQPRFLVRRYPGELHIAGLLHDIGKAILAVNAGERLETCLALATEKQIPLYMAEHEILGIDHGALGAHLLDEWLLPRPVLDAVGFHHAPGDGEHENRDLAGLIQFADATAWQCGINDGCLMESPQAGPLWIETQERRPLANPEVREKFLIEIHAELRARLVHADGENQTPNDEDDSPARQHATECHAHHHPAPRHAPGFWERLSHGLARLFGASGR